MIGGVGGAPNLGALTEARPGAAAIAPTPGVPEAEGATCRQCHPAGVPPRDGRPTSLLTRPVSSRCEEAFMAGKPQLAWRTFPGFSPDPLRAVPREDAPDGDGWVGTVTNSTFGGFASLAYAGDEGLTDYSVEAWVYIEVVPGRQGPIQGIAIRVDPNGERFYRLGAQLRAEPRLTLAYVGKDVNHFPVYLREWSAADIPGGTPKASGWHRMKLRAAGNKLWASWNDHELPGSPISDSRIRGGYFGVYANFVGGRQLAQTLVDGIVAKGDRG